MKKKSIAARLGILAAALTLVTTSLMSGTLAKYTFRGTATGTAIVAKWNPQVTIKDGSGTALSADFNLRELMTQTVNPKYLASGKVAPGCKGQMQIQVSLDELNVPPEVGAKYVVFIRDVTTSGVAPDRIQFSKSSAMTSPFIPKKMSDGAIPADPLISGIIEANASGTAAQPVLNIYWEWPYEDTASANSADNALGLMAETYKYQVVVVLDQLEPTATTPPTP